MKQTRTIAMVLLVAIATVGAIGRAGLLVQHANADTGNGATQFKGFPCLLGPAPPTTESHEVITPSGQTNEQCHA